MFPTQAAPLRKWRFLDGARCDRFFRGDFAVAGQGKQSDGRSAQRQSRLNDCSPLRSRRASEEIFRNGIIFFCNGKEDLLAIGLLEIVVWHWPQAAVIPQDLLERGARLCTRSHPAAPAVLPEATRVAGNTKTASLKAANFKHLQMNNRFQHACMTLLLFRAAATTENDALAHTRQEDLGARCRFILSRAPLPPTMSLGNLMPHRASLQGQCLLREGKISGG